LAKKAKTRRTTARRKSIEGDAGRRKSAKRASAKSAAELVARLTVPPPPPQDLQEEGRELWKKLAGQLVELKVLTVLDLEALHVLCDAWQTWLRLERYADPANAFFTTDKGYVAQHPGVQLRAAAAKTCAACWRQFGLTPLTREALDFELGENDNDLASFADGRGK